MGHIGVDPTVVRRDRDLNPDSLRNPLTPRNVDFLVKLLCLPNKVSRRTGAPDRPLPAITAVLINCYKKIFL
jgi:hypothetical protein